MKEEFILAFFGAIGLYFLLRHFFKKTVQVDPFAEILNSPKNKAKGQWDKE